ALALDSQDLGAPHDDLGELFGVVEVEPLYDAEACAHRRGQQAEARGRTDQREALDRHRDRLRLGAVRETDVDAVILHRRIEELLDDRTQAVDLVDEEDVALAQVREDADEIARLLEHRPRGRLDVHAQLARHQHGERGLAQAGRTVEERLVERLAPAERGLDGNPETVLDLGLANELGETLRPQRQLDRALFAQD